MFALNSKNKNIKWKVSTWRVCLADVHAREGNPSSKGYFIFPIQCYSQWGFFFIQFHFFQTHGIWGFTYTTFNGDKFVVIFPQSIMSHTLKFGCLAFFSLLEMDGSDLANGTQKIKINYFLGCKLFWKYLRIYKESTVGNWSGGHFGLYHQD